MKNSTQCYYFFIPSFLPNFLDKIRPHFFSILAGLSQLAMLFIWPAHSYSQLHSKNRHPVNEQSSPDLENTVRNTLKESSRKLQLIENDGQMGLPKNVVAYFSSGDQTIFIERDRLRVVIVKPTDVEKGSGFTPDKTAISCSEKNYEYSAFTIVFDGSSGFSALRKMNVLPTRRNFINALSAGCSVTDVGSYGEIVLQNVYPGVDLRLYSQQQAQMEFDWIISPKANPSLIKMSFEGQKHLTLDKSGDLQIILGLGNFRLHVPGSYYVTPSGKKQANIHLCLRGENTVEFEGFEKKQQNYPLVIDPDLLWGTFFDGGNANFDEYLYAVDFDNVDGLLYCAGAASRQVSTAYAAALSNAYDSTFSATPDAFVYALTKDGQTVKYITYLGGTNADVGIGISVGPSRIFVSGYTSSTDFPLTRVSNGDVQAFDTVYHGGDEGFVAVFNLALNQLIYSSFLGSAGNDKALTIRAVSDDSYYVSLDCGDTLSGTGTDYLVAAANNTFAGSSDGWIGQFTSLNALRFGTYVGGSGADLVNDFQVLSNGDVVFVGNTFGIAEINATVPNYAFGREVLFGRIVVPASGPVSFSLIEKIGGSGEDYGWGITTLGDSVSVIVGQTSSPDFPLGTGQPFQNANNGAFDGFVARINNDGTGQYQASFVGGSDDDILVSVRPVIVKNLPVLLAFGTTKSTDLSAVNHTGGSFFNNSNSGGYDMMWLICDLGVSFKYYLSYIGGSNNDYLGQTGAPVGSNHLFYNNADSVLYLGTTTHSYEWTQAPSFVGRGATDLVNAGVPVFDSTKDNSNNDTHVILAISVRMLFYTLPVNLQKFDAMVVSDCSTELTWQSANEDATRQFLVQRSDDGMNYVTIATIPAVGGNSFLYHDMNLPLNASKINYRIAAQAVDGQWTYSSVRAVPPCSRSLQRIRIYPTITRSYFVASGFSSSPHNVLVEVVDASGRKLLTRQVETVNGSLTVYFDRTPPTGTYFVFIHTGAKNDLLCSQKIVVQ